MYECGLWEFVCTYMDVDMLMRTCVDVETVFKGIGDTYITTHVYMQIDRSVYVMLFIRSIIHPLLIFEFKVSC